jgi:hypothetical protein
LALASQTRKPLDLVHQEAFTFMAIEIYKLPALHRLLKLDAQYFHNVASPGKAEHIIKVQYQAKHGKAQSFLIPLASDPKRINRKAREKLTPEEAADVAFTVKTLRGKGTPHFFGFRQVTVMERGEKGGRLFKRSQDANTFCWAIVRDGLLHLTIAWAGETLSLAITPHAGETSAGQSMGIGYWNRNEYLQQRMETLNGDLHGGTVRAEAPAEAATQSGQGSKAVARADGHGHGIELAATNGNTEAGYLGEQHPPRMASKERCDKAQGKRTAVRAAPKPAGSGNHLARKGDTGSSVDSIFADVWFAEAVPATPPTLGTSIRF